jgi:two-component system cell cycle sensor histidine kinase/response regulator CckA
MSDLPVRPPRKSLPAKPSPDLTTAERLYTLVEQIKDVAIFTLTPDGRVASWNPAVARVLGYDEGDFVGQSGSRLFTPEDRARGVPQQELAEAQGTASDDRWLVRKDGSRFWASGVTTSLWDEAGQLIGFGKVLRDLTEQKATQDRLEESEERLRLAIKAARVGTWRWDLRTNTDTLDENLARLLGLGANDVVTTIEDFFTRVHPDDRDRTREAFQDAVRRCTGLQVEFRVVGSDGVVRWLRDHGEVVVDEQDQPRFLTGTVVDITEQRTADERMRQVQRMDAVGKLAGGVAHEVNNMMTVALGFTDFLLKDLDQGDARRRDLEQVRAAGRAATVTAQLLAFSRLQVLQPRVLSLIEIVDELQPVLQRLLGENKELHIHRPLSVYHVKADRSQFEQVLINLLLNARDAMPQGGRVTIETTNVILDATYMVRHPHPQTAPVPSGPYVLLTVTDTGSGMDGATLQRIFEPFYTTKPMGQGTGLGLSVVYGIIKQSDGYIWAYSEPGQGTAFKVYLPAVTDTGERPPSPSSPATTPRGNETILVVEDEEMVRDWIVRFLEQQGYRCLAAVDGVEALQVMQAHTESIDLVVSDLLMPRMNGRELAEHLAGVQPDIPMLFLSGFTDDEMVRRNLLQSGAAFLQKPFDPQAFATMLRELLRVG